VSRSAIPTVWGSRCPAPRPQQASTFLQTPSSATSTEIAGLDRLPRQATFADGLRNMRVEEAIVKSAATGAAVTVPR